MNKFKSLFFPLKTCNGGTVVVVVVVVIFALRKTVVTSNREVLDVAFREPGTLFITAEDCTIVGVTSRVRCR